jgi:RHS repeat-associated protein
MSYDDGGRRLTVTNELGHTTTSTYDDQNNILTAEDELGNKTTNTYDAKGNLKTVVEANREVSGTAESGGSCGSAGTGDGADNDSDTVVDDGCPNVIYSYDDADRLIAVIDAIGNTTTYGYDANGNRTSVTNANRQTVGTAESGSSCGASGTGNDTDEDSDGTKDDGCPSVLYTYNNLNGLASEKDALGLTRSYAYDAASRLTTRTDAKSQQTTYGYNNRNDLTSIDYPSGTTDVSFQYDAARNRTQMIDATGTTTYSFDAVNRLSSVTFPGSRTVSYGYSNSGNRSSMTYPGGSNQVTYGYDAANHLTSVTDWNSNLTEYSYNDAGLLTAATLANDVVGTYTYDNADRLEGISWGKDSNVLAFVDYTLDAVGNRSQRVDGLGTHTYEYDQLYRITSADYPGADETDYTYDALSNRVTMVTGAGTTDYAYDASGRLTSEDPPGAGSTAYSWDNNGNLTARGSDSFSWSPEDLLVSSTVGGATTTFTYNGEGLRASLTANSTTTTFTWDINASSPQLVDDGTLKYVYGLGRISQLDGTDQYYFLPDALGSTMAMTDEDGDVVNSYEYDVFGAIRDSTGSVANAFTFAGEQEDSSTGLLYLRARYYDSSTGRFVARDRATPHGMDGQSFNDYGYVHANPTLYTDPSGLWCPRNPKDCIKAAGDLGIFARNAPITAAFWTVAELTGADCSGPDDDLFIVCSDASFGYFSGGTTWGNVFITGQPRDQIDANLLRHEKKHRVQYAVLRPDRFLVAYAANQLAGWILPGPSSCWNVFEWQAGFDDGDYNNPRAQWQCTGLGRYHLGPKE